ncbi:BPSS1780 family membrane protein [uncultured Thiothrix sp.]|uniref:BPSS1780 family membrane protein n=1 Tax=uncultured Thiothrix sp. TaxID=223185 RepID=UPI00261C7FF8|nr:BPSS1780 family membrane protein [uncultured Thiothrix sp.]
MNENTNPYAPPQANVKLAKPLVVGELLATPRSVSVGAGMGWLLQSWPLVKKDLGIWVLITLTLLAFELIAVFIPLVGSLILGILMPVFTGGLLLGIQAAEKGQPLAFESLFAGFQTKLSPLAILGLLNFVIFLALVIVFMSSAVVVAVVTGASPNPEDQYAGLLIVFLFIAGFLLFLAFFILTFLIWLAIPLVTLHHLPIAEALKLSWTASLRNFFSLFVFAIFAAILIFLGAVPLFLGLLIVVPLLYVSLYKSYQALFLQ